MKKGFALIIAVVSAAILLLIVIDSAGVYSDISRNDEVIKKLKHESTGNSRLINDITAKIDKINKDPKSVESLLIKKFKMLKKDQYIVYEKDN